MGFFFSVWWRKQNMTQNWTDQDCHPLGGIFESNSLLSFTPQIFIQWLPCSKPWLRAEERSPTLVSSLRPNEGKLDSPGIHSSLHTLHGNAWNSPQSLSPAPVRAVKGRKWARSCLWAQLREGPGVSSKPTPRSTGLPPSWPSSVFLYISALFPLCGVLALIAPFMSASLGLRHSMLLGREQKLITLEWGSPSHISCPQVSAFSYQECPPNTHTHSY